MKTCDVCGFNLDKPSCEGCGVDLCWFDNKPINHKEQCPVAFNITNNRRQG